MKVLLAFAAFSIAAVIGLSLPLNEDEVEPVMLDLATLEKLTALKNGGRSNALGELVAKYIMNFVNDLGDPARIINETSIDVFLNESIHISGVINASDVDIAGSSLLNITDAVFNLLPLGGEFTFYLPEIVVSGDYFIELLETSLFPLSIYGEGPFSVKLSSTALKTTFRLGTTLTGHLKLNSISYEVDVYEIVGRIDGLFSDVDASGELNEAVNILFNSYASILFNLFEANLHDNVTQLIFDVGNEILGNLTLADIIGIIGYEAPVELYNLPQY